MTLRKLLIANRGEIAVRIIRTARRLGLATVAVHSDADRDALHVALADEAVRIGPAAAAESYLDTEAVLAAARATGADAIHPGYGFLSENPDFVDAVEAAGLTFVGPSAEAIRKMGLKDAAKALMAEAGVPIVPGYHGEDQDPARLADEAEAIGYPVLIKARAGGGGKGMRRVDDPAAFAEALESAQREARAAFGDDRCLIEKYVATPRHIEIQVFGDAHGGVIHLFERDCSLQRRHQKVVEEAPAPGMTAEMRTAMGEAAVRAAEAIGYVGAGTVEFIVDASEGLRPDRFYFMEMNTRLQVEHPVTEAVTGLDLVALQLRVAGGAPLGLAQSDLALDGHAMEVRLYAEDAAAGFLPATGTLALLRLPEATARVDSGVREGDVITPHYDPMIAKIIVHGTDRAAALGRLARALAEVRIAGTVTNAAFLTRLVAQADFVAGDVDTGLIDRNLDDLTRAVPPGDTALCAAALAATGALAPAGELDRFRLWGPARQIARFVGDEDRLDIAVESRGDSHRVDLPDGPYDVRVDASAHRDGLETARLTRDGHSAEVAIFRDGDRMTVFAEGAAHEWALHRADRRDEEAADRDSVAAPMPGTVTRVTATPDATVEKGAPLAVMEAMKMEHTLRSPRDGRVAECLVAQGDQVESGAVLIRLAPEDAE